MAWNVVGWTVPPTSELRIMSQLETQVPSLRQVESMLGRSRVPVCE